MGLFNRKAKVSRTEEYRAANEIYYKKIANLGAHVTRAARISKLLAAMILAACAILTGCSADEAQIIRVTPGEETVLEDGVYATLTLDATMSGSTEHPTIIRAADGASPVIRLETGSLQSGDDGLEEAYGIHMVNVHDIIIEGISVEGGTHGIIYESTREAGDKPLENITIKDCKVSGVVGVHGICVYAQNDLAPVHGLTVTGCEVSGCQCGDSESLVLNGNIDGFAISENRIHDNNNIGIDMIGFEGIAIHPEGEEYANLYDADFVRNGKCWGNVVYNISAEGNPAYEEDDGYDLCADGIYVDGGQDIEIYDNFVYNCDIGIEVATERLAEENELFRVSGVEVHDNVIASCNGWCGLCFGGYEEDLGYTENCSFHHNKLIGNSEQIVEQKGRNNKVYDNILADADEEADVLDEKEFELWQSLQEE